MYQRILVPLDGSSTSDCGLREAIKLSKDLNARLHLLNVVDSYPMMMEMSSVASFKEMQQSLRRAGEEILTKAKSAAIEAGAMVETTQREVVEGRVAEVIVDEAEKSGSDLIVMGTHGRRGINRMVLGSEAELVARLSPTPVLLVREKTSPKS